jgi:CRISPR-associated protein Csb1
MSTKSEKFPECVESWLADNGPAAIVLREVLRAADALDDEPSTVFPPTYPPPEEKKNEEKSGYNISETRAGRLCLIDSIGSQANRLEPLFKVGKYAKLVPQITIKAGGTTVNLLDAGHRAGDAIVRCSDLADEIEKAFIAYRDFGNAVPLARIAPTSLLFGVWDSRGTQVKLPRLLASTIEATDVEPLVRSAQYTPATDYGDKGEGLLEGIDGADNQRLLSKAGFSHAPAPKTPGGVKVYGEIRRRATLSLVGIRELRGGNDGETRLLRQYVLGLALTALTADQGRTLNLRQGCLLTRAGGMEAVLQAVFADGTRQQVSVKHADAIGFAEKAAAEFNVGGSKEVVFKKERAKKEIAKAKKEKAGA